MTDGDLWATARTLLELQDKYIVDYVSDRMEAFIAKRDVESFSFWLDMAVRIAGIGTVH